MTNGCTVHYVVHSTQYSAQCSVVHRSVHSGVHNAVHSAPMGVGAHMAAIESHLAMERRAGDYHRHQKPHLLHRNHLFNLFIVIVKKGNNCYA